MKFQSHDSMEKSMSPGKPGFHLRRFTQPKSGVRFFLVWGSDIGVKVRRAIIHRIEPLIIKSASDPLDLRKAGLSQKGDPGHSKSFCLNFLAKDIRYREQWRVERISLLWIIEFAKLIRKSSTLWRRRRASIASQPTVPKWDILSEKSSFPLIKSLVSD